MRALLAAAVVIGSLVCVSGCVFTGDPVHDRMIVQYWQDDMHYIQQDIEFIAAVRGRSPLHPYQD